MYRIPYTHTRRPMELSDFTATQLERIYRRLYRQAGSGGWYGWDYPTLRLTYPSLYVAIRSVAYVHDEKL